MSADPVRYIVTRVETSPKAACPSTLTTCTKCGARCWQSLVMRHHFHRIELSNYETVCGICDGRHPADAPGLMEAAINAIPRARQFMPPRGHTLKVCHECSEPAWVPTKFYLWIIDLAPEVVIYCDNCVSGCADCGGVACG